MCFEFEYEITTKYAHGQEITQKKLTSAPSAPSPAALAMVGEIQTDNAAPAERDGIVCI